MGAAGRVTSATAVPPGRKPSIAVPTQAAASSNSCARCAVLERALFECEVRLDRTREYVARMLRLMHRFGVPTRLTENGEPSVYERRYARMNRPVPTTGAAKEQAQKRCREYRARNRDAYNARQRTRRKAKEGKT